MPITDITENIFPETGSYLPQNWVIKCYDQNINGKTQIFLRSTKAISPTSLSGATSLPPVGKTFM